MMGRKSNKDVREVHTFEKLLAVVGGSAIAIKSFLMVTYNLIVWPA